MSEAISKQTDNSFMVLTGPALRQAAHTLSMADNDQINQCLNTLSNKLKTNVQDILAANAKDVERAKVNNQTDAFIDRLTLNEERIEAMAQSVEDILKLDNPCGIILEDWTRPNGLHIQKISVPIGVLGIIYESRPNVTIDAAALCLKSHNACLLRGGSDSLNTALVLHAFIEESLKENGLPSSAVSMIKSGDRSLVGDMLKAYEHIDVIVPRGGRGLIERVMNEAAMPVFAHLDGNCHIFIDQNVDADMAREVVINAKLRRTGICGAVESLLFQDKLDQDTAKDIIMALLDQGCAVTGDQKIQTLDSRVQKANESDWSTEYLDAKISCKFVADIDEAINHINTYGSHHTDAIITKDKNNAARFQKEVDSAIVLHNASTQFADGGEFGMGAEIGIGTGKLHARGPVGVKQLTTFKYIVHGDGQTRL